MKKSADKRITTSGTTTILAQSSHVSQVLVSCTNAGTAWTLKIQNKEGTPKVLIPAYTLLIGITLFKFDESIMMRDGIDIVTSGTPGVVNVFIVAETNQ